MMQNDQQFEQLMMQYAQLRNCSEEISRLIENEDLDSAITMLNSREALFLSCKCMLKYLELTPEQQKELDVLLDEIRELEIRNIKKLETAKDEIQAELQKNQRNQKILQAYEFEEDSSGSIVNVQE